MLFLIIIMFIILIIIFRLNRISYFLYHFLYHIIHVILVLQILSWNRLIHPLSLKGLRYLYKYYWFMKQFNMWSYYDLINELIRSFIIIYHSFRIIMLSKQQQIISCCWDLYFSWHIQIQYIMSIILIQQ